MNGTLIFPLPEDLQMINFKAVINILICAVCGLLSLVVNCDATPSSHVVSGVDTGWAFPLDDNYNGTPLSNISFGFMSYFNTTYRYHYAQDLTTGYKENDPIYAMSDGEIIRIRKTGGYGGGSGTCSVPNDYNTLVVRYKYYRKDGSAGYVYVFYGHVKNIVKAPANATDKEILVNIPVYKGEKIAELNNPSDCNFVVHLHLSVMPEQLSPDYYDGYNDTQEKNGRSRPFDCSTRQNGGLWSKDWVDEDGIQKIPTGDKAFFDTYRPALSSSKKNFFFTNDFNGWSSRGEYTSLKLNDNGWLEMSPDTDPQLISPYLQFNPNDVDKLQIYTRNSSQNSSGVVYIATDKNPVYNNINNLPFSLPNDNRWHLIQIDVHKIPGWDTAGKITGIRIDPITNGNGTTDKIYIDYIKLRKNVQNTADSLVRWHPDGTLVKVANNPDVYFLEKGKKRLIPDEATFVANNFDWLNIITISDTELNGYSLGVPLVIPNGRLIKRSGSFPKCYLATEQNEKRWVKSEEAFNSLGFNFDEVENLAEGEFATFSDGPDITSIYPEGTLIKEKGKPDVYVISNGEPKPFASQATFQKLGYFVGDNDGDGIWDSIIEVNTLLGIPSLEPIKESQIYQTGNPGNPKVTMTWPLGGEKVIGNTLRTVTYKIENAVNVARVGIAFTVDKFKEILRFATDAPKNSQYTWQIPDVVSDGASVEITAYDYDGRPYSTSPETYIQIEKSDSVSQDYFDIYNDGGIPLEIKGITVDASSPWLKLSNPPTYPFSVTPNSNTRIKIAVDKSSLSPGEHTGNINVTSNDPTTPVIQVEVRLTINSDSIAPSVPVSIIVTPSGWSQSNSVAIDWTNPVDPSGIGGGYYKVGSPPQSNLDGTYFDISQKPLQLPVFSDGKYTVYVWLKDGVGNFDYTKSGFIEFEHDTTPPALSSRYPEDGAVNIPVDATISAYLVDEHAGIDPQSIVMKINGSQVSYTLDNSGNQNTFAVNYKPSTPFKLGETVEVSLVANDKTLPPNQMPLNSWKFTVTTLVPLATPTSIASQYQPSPANNYITWNSVDGATGYKVYWGTSPGVTFGNNVIGPITTLDYGHTGVAAGTTYYYRVSAFNDAEESALSGEVSVTVPPVQPTGHLKVTVSDGGLIYAPANEGELYRYGPSIILNKDNTIDIWTCAEDTGTPMDSIKHRKGAIDNSGGVQWLTPWKDALTATAGSSDLSSVCDPGVVYFNGYYYLGYTGTNQSTGGGYSNQIFVARCDGLPNGTVTCDKWNGAGWGGNPQPIISYSGNGWGKGQPSFVVKDNVLFMYYTDGGTKVVTVDATDANWPTLINESSSFTLFTNDTAALVLDGKPGPLDVKFVDALGKFVGIGISNEFDKDPTYSPSNIFVYESDDGINFQPVATTKAYWGSAPLQVAMHNIGISGDSAGHLSVDDRNFVAYGYGGPLSNGSWPTYLNLVNISALTQATVPAPPIIGVAFPGNAQATVTFTPPASDGGSVITGYTVTSSPAGGIDIDAGTTSLSHQIDGLINGTSYTFTVTATNAVGTSEPSVASNSVTPVAPVNGVCGSTNGTTSASTPLVDLCKVGTASPVSGVGPWTWSCFGSNGGSAANCKAFTENGPTLIINSLTDGSFTNEATLYISGIVSAVNGIQSVTINGSSMTVDSDGSFEYAFPLVKGSNAISIIATDMIGKSVNDVRGITLDIDSPTITSFTLPAYSDSKVVAILSLSGNDDYKVAGYLVTESSSTPSVSDSGWSVTAPDSHVFYSKGVKTLYSWVKDGAGNVSATASATVAITLSDVTMPAVTTLAIPPLVNTLTVTDISLTAIDNVGVTGYYLSESTATPALTAIDWRFAAPTDYTFTTAGSKTLYAFAKDAAGNVSTAVSADTIIDISPPALNVSSLANGSITNKNTLNVSGTVNDDNGIDSLYINDVEVTVNPNGEFSHALNLVNGVNTVTVIAEDKATNITSDIRTITLDQTAPNLTITAPADNSVTAQTLAIISGSIDESANVDVTSSLDGKQTATMNGNIFNANVNLSQGLNTINIDATDLAGNVSSAKRSITFDPLKPTVAITTPDDDLTIRSGSVTVSGMVNGTISDIASVVISADGKEYSPSVNNGSFTQQLNFTVDNTYPITVTATDQAGNSTTVTRNVIYTKGIIAINGGALFTATPKVILGLDYYPTAEFMQFYYNSKAWTKPEPYAASKIISLPRGDGSKFVSVRYLGASGNNLGEYSDSITLDTKVPTGVLKINNGDIFTNSRDVTLEVTATDLTSGLASLCIREDNHRCGVNEFTPYVATKSYVIVSPLEGKKTIYVTLKDLAGKISKPLKASIFLDTIPPIGTVLINKDAPITSTPAVTLKLVAKGAAEMQVSVDGGNNWSTWEKMAGTKLVNLPAGAGKKTVKARFKDLAGNVSADCEDSIELQ
jgi:hypothetical protein